MLITILAIFIASLIAPFYNRQKKLIAMLLSAIMLGVVVRYAFFLIPVSRGETFVARHQWIESLNVHLTFYLDGLSLFFAFLITGIGWLILLYSFRYMSGNKHAGRFFAFLMLFTGSMLGLVLSGNLLSLFVFWELTSFSSFLLIGFDHSKPEARRAARQALLVTAGGGLALLAGLILLNLAAEGDFDMITLIHQSVNIGKSDVVTASMILIIVGAMTKSAQFPFHFWLPNAMVAPTPVSAFLHSATMVKVGVYIIFRLNPVFQEHALWGPLLGITGAITMTLGAFRMLQQDDLKRILAYATISALGIFFMIAGLGGNHAMNAVILYLLAHALYKGGLFLIAGNVHKSTGYRKISQLSDLSRRMPFTTISAVLLCASMAGILPFIGFVGKEALYKVLLNSDGDLSLFYLILFFISGVAFMAVCMRITYNTFFGPEKQWKNEIREAGVLMIIPPLLMAAGGLVIGLAPHLFAEPLLQWSAASTYQGDPSMELKLWHGFNLVFVLSTLTLLTGAGLYFLLPGIRNVLSKQISDRIYDRFISGISQLAVRITQRIQNGYLRNYLTMILLTFSGLMILALSDGAIWTVLSVDNLFSGLQMYEVVILLLAVIAVIVLFKTRSRLIVSATFGIIGYGIALAFTLFSAPDVAITQFLAETLTLILLILILHKLPSYTLEKRIAHLKYLPVAVVFGIIMTLTTYVLLARDPASKLKSYTLSQSLPAGKGSNVVNVILTDFRALDTLGEITVLTITMIGIIALLNIKTSKR